MAGITTASSCTSSARNCSAGSGGIGPIVTGAPYVSALTLVDFNGDGALDAASAGAQVVLLSLGNGDGSFKPATSFSLPGAMGNMDSGLDSGDFNHDGFGDFVMTPSGFSVFLVTPRAPSLRRSTTQPATVLIPSLQKM